MYLSKIELNPARSDVHRIVADSYLVHKLLYALFDDPNSERILFRIETPEDRAPWILFQSLKSEPDFQRLDLKLSELLRMPETKLFEPHLEVGQRLGFRLLARPSKRIGNKEDANKGKRKALREDEDKLSWLQRQGLAHGFAVEGCDLTYMSFWDFRPVHKKLQDKPAGPNGATRFDGVLRVTDVSAFKIAIESGIGPQKGFGFGLLSIGRT